LLPHVCLFECLSAVHFLFEARQLVGGHTRNPASYDFQIYVLLGLAIISRRIGMPGALPNGDDASASSTEPPDVSPESLPKGGCSQCTSALRPFELCWGSGQCNRCYNKEQGGARCDGCQKGLWNCELKLPSGRCCECFPLKCTECKGNLTAVEVRWVNHCCNRCYNLWKGTTPACNWCENGLLLPEMKGRSMYCVPCRKAWGRF